LYTLLCLVLSLAMSNPRLMQSMSIGLWPILFCDIVIECNKDPEVGRMLVKVKKLIICIGYVVSQ
jgi:hypothetical protein